MPVASGAENTTSTAPIRIHQDINMYATYLTTGKTLPFEIEPGRQAYLALAEGKARVNGVELNARDAMEITEEPITVEALEDAHMVIIEMVKG
jgi:redox-sensitive bicupin YhaK (pirin superfamily)